MWCTPLTHRHSDRYTAETSNHRPYRKGRVWRIVTYIIGLLQYNITSIATCAQFSGNDKFYRQLQQRIFEAHATEFFVLKDIKLLVIFIITYVNSNSPSSLLHLSSIKLFFFSILSLQPDFVIKKSIVFVRLVNLSMSTAVYLHICRAHTNMLSIIIIFSTIF